MSVYFSTTRGTFMKKVTPNIIEASSSRDVDGDPLQETLNPASKRKKHLFERGPDQSRTGYDSEILGSEKERWRLL